MKTILSAFGFRSTLAIAAVMGLALQSANIAFAAGDPDQDPPLSALGPPPIPADNPQTPAKVALGKKLFFDGRLSGNGVASCAFCHIPAAGWSVPTPLSLGYPGTAHWRNSQSVVNAAYYKKLFWAGSATSLEKQSKSAATGAVGGNGEADVMAARLAVVPEYRKEFKEVFGTDTPLIGDAYRAIAAYQRTLVQTDTPFDRYAKGDKNALTPAQKRGMQVFNGKGNCIDCHNTALASDEDYYNLGVPRAQEWLNNPIAQITFRYELYAKGVKESVYRETKDDLGLYFRTKQDRDKGKFRTASLRYVVHTAPYMHNGSIATLEDVVDFYNRGGGENEFTKKYNNKAKSLKPLNLTDEEKKDLVAFIQSLSGDPITE